MDWRQFVAFWTLFLVGDCQEAMIIAPSPCSLPKVVGPCEALIPRWFYNAATGQCEEFNYGGCQGNTNNFQDEISCTELCEAKPGTCPEVEPGTFGICVEECSTDADCPKDDLCCSNGCGHVCKSPFAPPVDRCQLPIVSGPCRGSFPSWGFNAETGRCESFVYGGCKGNDNRFASEQECCEGCNAKSSCICELPSETGNCRAVIPRWHYDLKAGKCVQFSYGGCGGNANNFETDWECEGRCGKRNFIATCPVGELAGPCVNTCTDNSQCKPMDICCDNGCGRTCYRPETKEPCELPIDQGECKARLERWGFNAETQQCEKFYYGGCLGNINNFATEAECQESCCRPRKACYQPIVPGPCKGSISRYAFNINTGKCEMFTYGGCGGNDNNFSSMKRCRRKCRKARKDYQCYQPFANQWLCIRYEPTWGYDHCKGECVEYGLCGSTDNHFDTAKDCRKKCMKKKRRKRNDRP